MVDPGYFTTMGMEILRGRGFTATDDENALPVVLVNETMARRFWPASDAIGATLAADHGVSIQGRDRPILYNLHILDIGDQLVKVNPAGDGSEDGLLACSRLEYTTTAPDNYTNGISAHNAHRWVVRDNEWARILTNDGTPVPAILFWNGSSDTIVERNFLLDCGRGIAFGLSSGHSGGERDKRDLVRRDPWSDSEQRRGHEPLGQSAVEPRRHRTIEILARTTKKEPVAAAMVR